MSVLANDWSSWIKLLKQVVDEQKRVRQDYLFLLVGSEGSGKSNGMLHTYEHLINLKNDDLNVNHIAGDIKGFFKSLYLKKRDGVHVLDEGKELVGINASTKIVRKFNEVITTIREMGNVYMICFRNPLYLQGYIRDEKIFAVLVFWKTGTKEKNDLQYFCAVYKRQDFNDIIDDIIRKKKQRTIPNIIAYKNWMFLCKPPEYKGVLLEPYAQLKNSMQVDTIDGAYNEFCLDKSKDDNKRMRKCAKCGHVWASASKAIKAKCTSCLKDHGLLIESEDKRMDSAESVTDFNFAVETENPNQESDYI